MKTWFLICIVVIATAGCATTDRIVYDDTPRPPTQNVKMYPKGTVPDAKYARIATLTFLGPPEDEGKAIRHFIKDAKKLGADGVVYLGPEMPQMKGGLVIGRGGGFGHFGEAYIFKADAIVTEH